MSDNIDAKPNSSEDKELDDLLNSALQDFDKVPKEETASKDVVDPTVDQTWADLPDNMKQLEERMASLFANEAGEGPSMDQLTLGFQKMAEAAMMTIQGEADNVADPKIVESITGAIKGLQEGSDNMQAPVDQDVLAGMFSGLTEGGGGAPEDGGNPFLPFMQGMMRSLLSAEVLLPSLKELLEKYPKWLEENGDKIDASEKERYVKQQKLFEVICADLESEKPEDSEDVKNERFKKVLENMQLLNEYGQPPAELVGEAGAPNIPNLGDPSMADPSQCSVM